MSVRQSSLIWLRAVRLEKPSCAHAGPYCVRNPLEDQDRGIRLGELAGQLSLRDMNDGLRKAQLLLLREQGARPRN
ncbi:hypothetical protein GCM10011586_11140 [Silvibacterium dinghuense]|nr:hypothetical protein GCM10011586_11140 [Silvibacterium dinghuense]